MTFSRRIAAVIAVAVMAGGLIWSAAAYAEPAASVGTAADLDLERIDKVEWPDALRDHKFKADYEAILKAGMPTPQRAVQHVLGLIDDLPGFSIDEPGYKRSRRMKNAVTFQPAATYRPYEAVVRTEAQASRDHPAYQQSGWLQLNNLLRLNEQLTVIATDARSDSAAQAFGLGYRQALTSSGLNFVFSAGYARGKAGASVEIEGLQGDVLGFPLQSRNMEVGLRHPLLLSKDLSVFATALIYATDAQTDPFPQTFYQDRLRSIRASLDGAAAVLGGSVDYNIIVNRGFIGLGSTGNNNPFASIATGRADATNVEMTASYARPLSERAYLALGFDAQYAFTPLLAPAQCSYGGRVFGRAYRVDQLTGDHCINLSAELHGEVPMPFSNMTPLHLYTFIDYGNLTNIAPNPGTPAHIHAASAGPGLWVLWQEKVTVHWWGAKAINGPDNGWRSMLSMAARF
jgi:hemolysin activation/secretion protein